MKQVEISCLLLEGTTCSKREALKTYSASGVKITFYLLFSWWFILHMPLTSFTVLLNIIRDALWLCARRQIHMSTNLTASSILASVLYLTPAWSFVQASFCRVWTSFEILIVGNSFLLVSICMQHFCDTLRANGSTRQGWIYNFG